MGEGPAKLDVAVVGVGRMGQHHARIYRKLPDVKLVAVVDSSAERAETVAEDLGCRFYTSTEELLSNHPGIKGVSVAVPTAAHVAVAQPLLERRIACLVEKPMAPTSSQARILMETASRSGAVLQIGHTERFNPAVRAVVNLGIQARFMEVRRISPMTFRSLDVGVVMDMMIHDLDIVLMMANSPLDRVEAVGISVISQHEDVANARLVFKSGCVADITASRLALKTERKLRLFSEDAYVSLDYQLRTGVVVRKSENAQLGEVRRQLAAGEDFSTLDYSKLVKVDELTMDLPEGEKDPLTAELSSFVHAVRTGNAPIVDAMAGYAAVEAAERVVGSIQRHKWEGLKGGDLL